MNTDTLLLRQVNPSWMRNDRVTSQAFRPTPKDEGRLSTYDGDRITPEDSWRHFTGFLGHRSAGVLAVTVGECEDQNAPAIPDPQTFREHVVIDFTGLTRSATRNAAKTLAHLANERGWQYGPVQARDTP